MRRHWIAALLLLARPLAGQETTWDAEGEIGASLFFGNSEQILLTSRAAIAHADSAFALSTDVNFAYGEVTRDGGTAVSKRSWQVGLSANLHPFALASPFLQLSAESSLEKRVHGRYNGGVGAKLALLQRAGSTLNVRVALLAERLTPREPAVDGTQIFGRWSASARGKYAFADGRLTLSTDLAYRPEFGGAGSFTFESTTGLAYQISRVVSLKLTFVDNYDSEARNRGARSNNDGYVFFGVLGSL